MKRTVIFGDREITYDFSRSTVKNLNARVRRDGSLAVSVPRRCTDRQAETFLLTHLPALLLAMDEITTRTAAPPKKLADGATIPLLGAPVVLHLARGSQRGVEEKEGELFLTLRPDEGEGCYALLLSSYLYDRAEEMISGICRELYDSFFEKSFPYPTIRYRRMTARWGSCRKQSGLILFNPRLLYAPLPAIEYVVLHELTHMLHPDHSARFYAAVAAHMPDYKSRAAALKAVDLRREPWL